MHPSGSFNPARKERQLARPEGCFFSSKGRCGAGTRTGAGAANRNDLHAAIVTLAVAAGDNPFEFGESQMDDPAIAGIHRLESDDLALFDGLAAEPSRH